MHLPSPAELAALPLAEQQRVLRLVKELEESRRVEAARNGFMSFVEYMWPGFINGAHHRRVADAFDRVVFGDLKRLIINLGPRHTKSEFTSKFLPAFKFGVQPDAKVIQTGHTAEFATGWGRKVRNLVATPRYQKVFPGTSLVADSKASGRWDTSAEGEYFAVGVGGAVTGRGANLLIIDDPHTEQDFIQAIISGSPEVFDRVYEWYTAGPRQRLQPGAAIVIVMTRWHMRDLTGKLIKRMMMNPKADRWEIIELPALLPSGNPLWPEFWPLEELLATKEELSPAQWNAQYMQNPTSEEGALIKRESWRIWPHEKPPQCEFVIMAWDTAYTKHHKNDYSAMTTWGIFDHLNEEGEMRPNIILLDAFRDRIEFPQLKKMALHYWKERQPDAFIVEAKASGLSLIQELRAMGIPVTDFTPVRGTRASPNDKKYRVHSVTDIFASGLVWRPDTRWAEDVVEECAAFPAGENDDWVDTVVMALNRYRQGGYIRLPDDDVEDEDVYPEPADYY